MTQERYKRIVEIFLDAADLEGEKRSAFLNKACEGDEDLKKDVERMLAQDQVKDDLFEEQRIKNGMELISKVVKGELGDMPERVGPFKILKKIGEGGMGSVYLAEQEHPRRQVALKMIRTGLYSQSMLERFRFEEETLGRLKHPGVAQIYEGGETRSGAPYFAMEYVDGVELRRYAKDRDLTIEAKLELIARICDGAHHAHLKGILHRDLKPENVFVVDDSATPGSSMFANLGQPKILDFGVARATDTDVGVTITGQLVGTLTYMSPEQVAGDSRDLDARSDIYALGAMLFELLKGQPPYQLMSIPIPEAARIIKEDEPARLGAGLRGDIETIVFKAMAKDRERRYLSAAEMAGDIRRHLAHEPILARGPSLLYQLQKFSKRHRGMVIGLVFSFLILIAGVITSLNFAFQAKKEERQTKRAMIRLNISAAEAMGDSDPLRALSHLDQTPEDSRGWEWRHLHSRFKAHVAESFGRPWPCEPCACTAMGTLAALHSETGVSVIDLLTRKSKAEISDPMNHLTLCPNGLYLAGFSKNDSAWKLWRLSDQKLILKIPESCRYLRMSEDGALLGICTPQSGVKVIESATNRIRFETAPYPTDARFLAMSKNGERVAIVGGNYEDRLVDAGYFYLYLYSGAGDLFTHIFESQGAISLAISPDGTKVAVGHRERMISIYEADSLKKIAVLYGHTQEVCCLAFSSNNNLLASASSDQTVRLWDLKTGGALQVFYCPNNPHGISSLSFSKDGSYLAGGNSSGTRLWKLNEDAEMVLKASDNYVYNVAFSPDSALLACGDWDQNIVLWHAITGEKLTQFKGYNPNSWLCFSEDGNRILEDKIWDPVSGQCLEEPRLPWDKVLFSEYGVINPEIYYMQRVAPGGTSASMRNTFALAISFDRTMAANNLSTQTIQISDRKTNGLIYELGEQSARAYTMAFSPNGKHLVSGDLEGKITVWEFPSQKIITQFQGHKNKIYSVSFSPDGSRLASGGDDGAVILWDGETFEQAIVLLGHTSYVHSVVFSPDGTKIASGSGDGTVRIWDTVSRVDRFKGIQELMDLRRKAEPKVRKLLKELKDPLDAADSLRTDPSLDQDQRREALAILFRLTQ